MVSSPSFLALFSNVRKHHTHTHPSPRSSGASEPEGHLLDYTVAQAVSSSSETASANTPFVTWVVKEEYKRKYITTWHVRLPFRSTYSSMVPILTTSQIGGLGREAFNHHPFCWPKTSHDFACAVLEEMLVGCEWRVLVYLENIFDSFHFSCQSSFGGSSTIVLLTNTAFSWGFFFISFRSIACFCPRFSTFEFLNSFFWRFYYQWSYGRDNPSTAC